MSQIGADTYNSSRVRKLAFGSEAGLGKEWDAQSGGNADRSAPFEAGGVLPWVSLHAADLKGPQEGGATANRGLILRSWKARVLLSLLRQAFRVRLALGTVAFRSPLISNIGGLHRSEFCAIPLGTRLKACRLRAF